MLLVNEASSAGGGGYAGNHYLEMFHVTRLGCGLAGYTEEPIAPMFAEASANCVLDISWLHFLPNNATTYPANERSKS